MALPTFEEIKALAEEGAPPAPSVSADPSAALPTFEQIKALAETPEVPVPSAEPEPTSFVARSGRVIRRLFQGPFQAEGLPATAAAAGASPNELALEPPPSQAEVRATPPGAPGEGVLPSGPKEAGPIRMGPLLGGPRLSPAEAEEAVDVATGRVSPSNPLPDRAMNLDVGPEAQHRDLAAEAEARRVNRLPPEAQAIEAGTYTPPPEAIALPQSLEPAETVAEVGGGEVPVPPTLESEKWWRAAAARGRRALASTVTEPSVAAYNDPWMRAFQRFEQDIARSPFMAGVRRGLDTSIPGNVTRSALAKIEADQAMDSPVEGAGHIAEQATRLFADYGLFKIGAEIGAAAMQPLFRALGLLTAEAAVRPAFERIAQMTRPVPTAALARAGEFAEPLTVEQANALAGQIVERVGRAMAIFGRVTGAASATGGGVGFMQGLQELTRQLADDPHFDWLRVGTETGKGAAAGFAGGALLAPVRGDMLHLLGAAGYWGAVYPLVVEGRTPTVADLIAVGIPLAALSAAARVVAARRAQVAPVLEVPGARRPGEPPPVAEEPPSGPSTPPPSGPPGLERLAPRPPEEPLRPVEPIIPRDIAPIPAPRRARTALAELRPLPAEFVGIERRGAENVVLFRLTQPVGQRPAGSTITAPEALDEGYDPLRLAALAPEIEQARKRLAVEPAPTAQAAPTESTTVSAQPQPAAAVSPTTPPITAERAQEALDAAEGDWLQAAQDLAPSPEPRDVLHAATLAARSSPPFWKAMGSRPHTVAQVAVEIERRRPDFEGFDPNDDQMLARFVMDHGGIAPSPTADLQGEYEALPRRFRNRRGLAPAAMAEAINEAAAQGHEVLNDADLLRRLVKAPVREERRGAARQAAVEGERAREQAAAEDQAILERLREDPERAKGYMQQVLGVDRAELDAFLAEQAKRKAAEEFDPAKFEALDTLEGVLRQHFVAFPAEEAVPELFDFLTGGRTTDGREIPDLRGRFGTAEEVTQRLFGGDRAALETFVQQAKSAGVSRGTPVVEQPEPPYVPAQRGRGEITRGRPRPPGIAWGLDHPLLSADDTYPAGTRVFMPLPEGEIVWEKTGKVAPSGYALFRGRLGGRGRTMDGGSVWNLPEEEYRKGPWPFQLPGDPPEVRRSVERMAPAPDHVVEGEARDLGRAGAQPRFEPTPLGEQALIPGTPTREQPRGPSRAHAPQQDFAETPLGQAMQAARAGRQAEQAALPLAESAKAQAKAAHAQEKAATAQEKAAKALGDAAAALSKAATPDEAPMARSAGAAGEQPGGADMVAAVLEGAAIPGTPYRLVDSSRTVDPALMRELAGAPHTRRLHEGLAAVTDGIRDRLAGDDPALRDAFFLGTSLDPRHHGISVPLGGQRAILLSIYQLARGVELLVRRGHVDALYAPRRLAEALAYVVIHELTHGQVPHSPAPDAAFESALDRNISRAMVALEATTDSLQQTLEDHGHALYNAVVRDAERIEAHRRRRTDGGPLRAGSDLGPADLAASGGRRTRRRADVPIPVPAPGSVGPPADVGGGRPGEGVEAPVRWLHWQEGFGTRPAFEQWNLTAPVGGHPEGSTLSREALKAIGIEAPPPPEPAPAPQAHTYSSTEIRLPAGLADAVHRMARGIPKEDLAQEVPAQPHITIRYGIQSVDPDRVKDALAGQDPVEITLGPVKRFPDAGEGEILYVEAQGEGLDWLHEALTERLTVVETQARFQPHVTLAFVRPGRATDLDGDRRFGGRRFTATEVVFTPRDGSEPTVLPLRAAPSEPEPATAAAQLATGAAEAGRDPFLTTAVRTRDGEIRTVYHATVAPPFERFDPARQYRAASHGKGFYFYEDLDVAQGNLEHLTGSRRRREDTAGTPRIVRTQLAVSKAFHDDATPIDPATRAVFADAIDTTGLETGHDMWKALRDQLGSKAAAVQEIRRQGFDGLAFTHPAMGRAWVVFEPEQVRILPEIEAEGERNQPSSEEVRRALAASVIVPSTQYRVADTSTSLPDEAIRAVAGAPYMAAVASELSGIVDAIAQELSAYDPRYGKAYFYGLSLDPRHRGFNAQVGGQGLVLINLLRIASDIEAMARAGNIREREAPFVLAQVLARIATHEVTHQTIGHAPSGETDTAFEAAFAVNIERARLVERRTRAALARQLGEDHGRLYRDILSDHATAESQRGRIRRAGDIAGGPRGPETRFSRSLPPEIPRRRARRREVVSDRGLGGEQPLEPIGPVRPEPEYGEPADIQKAPQQVRVARKALYHLDTATDPAFRRWFEGSRRVTPEGDPKVYYRGDNRADRLDRLRHGRATSARGFFFTDNPEIASNYARTKPDTGAVDDIQEPGDFRRWFHFRVPGQRRPVDLHQLWYHLDEAQRARVAQVMVASGYTEGAGRPFDFSGSNAVASPEHWAFTLREHHGNWLMAGQDVWLQSALLHGDDDEARFLDILAEAGITNGEYTSPWAQAPAVAPVYLRQLNPLDTAAIPAAVVERLRAVARRSRRQPRGVGDFWATSTITPKIWMSALEEDLVKGTRLAWTSLPPEIVRALQAMGYDGVSDVGGKMGGQAHEVAIVFEPWQAKSIWNRGTWDSGSDWLVRQPEPEYGLPDRAVSETPDERLARVKAALATGAIQPVEWYSALRKVADAKLPERAPAEQILRTLAQSKGVKKAEIHWTGLEAWLATQTGPVSKAEVLTFLDTEGAVRIATRELSESRAQTEADRARAAALREAQGVGLDVEYFGDEGYSGARAFADAWSDAEFLPPDEEYAADERKEFGEDWEPDPESLDRVYTHPAGYAALGNDEQGYEVIVGPDWRRPVGFLRAHGAAPLYKPFAEGGGVEWDDVNRAMNAAWEHYSEYQDRASQAEAQAAMGQLRDRASMPMHGIEITPAMGESALTEGFALFQQEAGYGEGYGRSRQPEWTSRVRDVVASPKMPTRAPGEQWLRTLEKAAGVKREEMEWLGLPEWLSAQTGPVPRETLLEKIDAESPLVTVVVRGEPSEELIQRLREIEGEVAAAKGRLAGALRRLHEDLVTAGVDADRAVELAVNALLPQMRRFGYPLPARVPAAMADAWIGDRLSLEAVRAIRAAYYGVPAEQYESVVPEINTEFRYANALNALIDTDKRWRELEREQERLRHEALLPLPKFSGQPGYNTPGGTNPREVLFTLPPIPLMRPTLTALPAEYEPIYDRTEPEGRQWAVTSADPASARPWHGRHATREIAIADAIEALNRERSFERPQLRPSWTSHAFPERDIVMWGRVWDQRGPKGEKYLHVDEIQADLHERGAKEGYRTPDRFIEGHDYDWWSEEALRLFGSSVREDWAAAIANSDRLAGRPDEVPAAPWPKTWHERDFRWLAHWAAIQGYDGITWTTGEQQNQRWGKAIAQQFTRISYNEARGALLADVRGGGTIRQNVEPANLPGYIGQALTDRLLSTTTPTFRIESAQDWDPAHGIAPRFVGNQGAWVVVENWPGTERDQTANHYLTVAAAEESRARAERDFGGLHTLEGDDLIWTKPASFLNQLYDEKLGQVARDLGKRFGVQPTTTKLPATADMWWNEEKEQWEPPPGTLFERGSPLSVVQQAGHWFIRHEAMPGEAPRPRVTQQPVADGWEGVLTTDWGIYPTREDAERALSDQQKTYGEGPMAQAQEAHLLSFTPPMRQALAEQPVALFQRLLPFPEPDPHDATSQAEEVLRGFTPRATAGPGAKDLARATLAAAASAVNGARSLRADLRPGVRPGAGPALGPALRRPAGQPGRPERGGVKLHALSVAAELPARAVSLRDVVLSEAHPEQDLAFLAQPIRDPRWETLSLVAFKTVPTGKQLLGVHSLSSRVPNSVPAFEIGRTQDHLRYFHELREWMRRLGADGAYLMHNHPSGDPTPSKEDGMVSADFEAFLPGYAGHVIINSRRYGFIPPVGIARRTALPAGQAFSRKVTGTRMGRILGNEMVRFRTAEIEAEVRPLPGIQETLLVPSIPHPLVGITIADEATLASAGHAIQQAAPAQVIVFYTMQNRVKAIESMSPNLYAKLAMAAAYIQGRMREYGGSRVLTYAPWSLGEAVIEAGAALLRDGVIADHIVGADRSPWGLRTLAEEERVALPEFAPFARREFARGGRRMGQPEERYGAGRSAADIERDLDTLGRHWLQQYPDDYVAWREGMRSWLTPGFHDQLPVIYARITGAAPTGGESTVTPPRTEAEPPPARGGVQPGLPGTSVAGEGTPAAPRMAANINLDKWETLEDVKRLMEDLAAQNAPAIERQRRGVRTWEETIEAARRSGMTAERILETQPGDIWNAEELQAARQIVVAAAEGLYAAQARSSAPNAGPEDLAAFVQQIQRFNALMKALTGLTAEAGRVLNQQKIKVRALEEWRRLIDRFGGEGFTREVAEALGRVPPENLAAVAATVRAATHPNASDKFYWLWINNILSGPHTHIVNTFSNTLFYWMAAGPERAIAAAVDAVLATATGRQRERFLGEAMAEMYAFGQGFSDGLAALSLSWREKRAVFGASKEEVLSREPAIGGRFGAIWGAPTRALQAEDEFAKAVAYRTSLHALSFRAAAQEGLTGRARWTRAAEIANEASADAPRWQALAEEAAHEAHRRTFTDEVGWMVTALLKFRDARAPANTPTLMTRMFLRWVVPFVRTPSRIFAQAGHYSPAQFFWLAAHEIASRVQQRAWEKAYGEGAAGGAGGPGGPSGPQPPLPGMPPPPPPPRPEPPEFLRGGKLADEIARGLMGSAMVALFLAALVYFELITGGGGTFSGDKRIRRRTRPDYSVWTPWGYLSGYQRLAPLGTVLGVFADLTEELFGRPQGADREWPARMLGTVNQNVIQQSFMLGPRDTARAVAESERYAQGWSQGLVSSVISQFLAQVAPLFDPTARQATTMGEAIQRKIPIASRWLQPQIDVFGEPETRSLGARLTKLAAPLDWSPLKEDRVARELERLGIGIARPGKVIAGIDLKPEERTLYEITTGTAIRRILDRAMFGEGDEDTGYRERGFAAQRKTAERAISLGRREGRNAVLRAIMTEGGEEPTEAGRAAFKRRGEERIDKRLAPAVRESVQSERAAKAKEALEAEEAEARRERE